MTARVTAPVKTVRYHDEARLEFLHEVGFYAAISPRLGERFDKAVEQAEKLAATYPESGAPFKYGTRRILTKKCPFSLVYVACGDEILVLAIAPFKRKPGYWRSRVTPV